jgi:hypothetical protein
MRIIKDLPTFPELLTNQRHLIRLYLLLTGLSFWLFLMSFILYLITGDGAAILFQMFFSIVTFSLLYSTEEVINLNKEIKQFCAGRNRKAE